MIDQSIAAMLDHAGLNNLNPSHRMTQDQTLLRYTDAELRDELDRRSTDHIKAKSAARQNLGRLSRLSGTVATARDRLDHAVAELTKRRKVMDEMRAQGLLARAGDLREREILVEQAERVVAQAQTDLDAAIAAEEAAR